MILFVLCYSWKERLVKILGLYYRNSLFINCIKGSFLWLGVNLIEIVNLYELIIGGRGFRRVLLFYRILVFLAI